MYMGEIVSTYQ